MITANFIHRTFRIRAGDSSGTAFTIDVGRRQYVVTARHVIEDQGNIAFLFNGTWKAIDATLVGLAHGEIDVAVLALPVPLSPPNLPVRVSSDGLAYGQEVFFLGYPYGLRGLPNFGEEGYHLPLVKRATLSTFAGDAFLLDGHNNPGFSGGPVIFGPRSSPPTNIAAVIVGFRYQPEPVFEGESPTGFSYKYNTGIIICYKIEIALDLIKKNPIGADL